MVDYIIRGDNSNQILKINRRLEITHIKLFPKTNGFGEQKLSNLL